ncbi:hypothetical protein GGI20_002623 [Coemansia sp. BCRC 34301]|nr:hypothetical protein GGI20_002623 [Coemansia sp. BCRC 34301]
MRALTLRVAFQKRAMAFLSTSAGSDGKSKGKAPVSKKDNDDEQRVNEREQAMAAAEIAKEGSERVAPSSPTTKSRVHELHK